MVTEDRLQEAQRADRRRTEALLIVMYELELRSGRQVVPIVNPEGRLVSFYSVQREDWLPQ